MTAPILVAGGGIGGVAAALGLGRAGFPVTLLERAPELAEIGAGIQLGPNAFRAFDYLGVANDVRRVGVFIEAMTMMDAMSGEEIASVGLEEAFNRRFGNPYAVVHRGELHRCLVAACETLPNVTLMTSSEVADYRQDERGVAAILADGRVVSGRALVGADGLMSKMREKVVGDGAPLVTGHTTYRSVIPYERMAAALRWDRMTIWVGDKCHLVHYPLSGRKLFNLVVTVHDNATESVKGRSVSHAEVAARFAHIHTTPQQIISHGADWKMWVLCDRDPVTQWRDGRVVLLGDAAHPMRQYLAQGACMALEDAVCLARSVIDCPDDVERAFEAYRVRRIERTAQVQLNSRRIGDVVFHASGADAERRNRVMRGLSEADYYELMDWLYGGDEAESRSTGPALRVLPAA